MHHGRPGRNLVYRGQRGSYLWDPHTNSSTYLVDMPTGIGILGRGASYYMQKAWFTSKIMQTEAVKGF